MKNVLVWLFRKTLLLSLRFAIMANKEALASGQILQVKFGRKLAGGKYDALLVVADGSVVKIHDAKAVEVDSEGNIKDESGPTFH